LELEMIFDRKIAFIHLTDGTIETEPISIDLRRKFLGGRSAMISLPIQGRGEWYGGMNC